MTTEPHEKYLDLARQIDRYCRSNSAPTTETAAHHVARLIAAATAWEDELQEIEARTNAENGRLLRELDALRPKWTTEPPTVKGAYWARWADRSGVEITEMMADDEKYVYSGERAYEVGAFDLWAGPLEAPPLPGRELTEWQRAEGRTHRQGQASEAVETPPLPERK